MSYSHYGIIIKALNKIIIGGINMVQVIASTQTKEIDVVCIGAINFDYIFSNQKFEFSKKRRTIDDGEESFVDTRTFNDLLTETKKHVKDYYVSIGGSALLTLKAVKEMCSSLKTAYVGVYGEIPPDSGKKISIHTINDLKKEFKKFIDDDTWLFYEKHSTSGRAVVNQFKKRREFIKIDPGVNHKLYSCINQIGDDEFIAFLSSVKWIHITSLPNIGDFLKICGLIGEAKKINRQLKVSIDPGYEYTKSHWTELKEVLNVADFVFLSKIEYDNVCQNLRINEHNKINRVGTELRAGNSNAQVIIIKEQSKTMLISLVGDENYKRTYYHKKLPSFSIMNDTGAGDVFAGGFIAGMLMPAMLSYQPAPINLGATAAREKLKAEKWPEHLKDITYDFYEKNMKNESRNIKQRAKMFLKNPIISMFLGAIVGKFLDDLIDVIKFCFLWLSGNV